MNKLFDDLLIECAENNYKKGYQKAKKETLLICAKEELEFLDNLDIEELADLEHKQWSHWTKYMLDKLYSLFSPDALADENELTDLKRWNKQIKTEYKDLTEKEKDSDREWAIKVKEIICSKRISQLQEIIKKLEEMK